VCETPSWRLEPQPLPSCPTSTYICGVTITSRVCGGEFSNIWEEVATKKY